MAVAPQLSAFEILDLRLLRPQSLAPLFEEELRLWREQLHWDFHPSVEMIRKHLTARSLPGYAALSQGQVAGYCFFVYEEEKGLLGDLYVLEAHRRARPYGPSAGIATLLLEHALETLMQSPTVRRIEAQLVPFGIEPLAPIFRAHNFRVFPRLFMYKQLKPGAVPPALPAEQKGERGAGSASVELRLWTDSYLEAMGDLIVAAYRGHVDSAINDHYRTRAGALRFLKNLVVFPGCGVFQPDCSLVAVEAVPGDPRPVDGNLVGALLTSQVAPRIGHITQICLRREWQGRGLGRRLMHAALEHLTTKGYRGVSLTVTAENQPAVQLYRQFGFDVLKEFAAFARTLRPE
ncbi:MAG: GNAT family N-acetyltransferase [Terriglobia bacterium]